MKIDNKGFTLVEMIASLIIICSLCLLSFSTIINIINNTNIKLSESQETIIKEAAKDYLESNVTYEQNDGDNYCISVKKFLDNENLDKKQIPDIDESNIINISVTKEGLDISLDKNCIEETNKVTFELIGKKNLTVGKGSTLTDPGFTAKNKNEEDIKNDVSVNYYDKQMDQITSINTNFIGDYLIEYILEIDNKTYVLERGVTVELSDDPVIVHPGDTTIFSNIKEFDILEGVSATDVNGDELEILVTTNLTLGLAGKYSIEYQAVDKSGNKKTSIRNIKIILPYIESLLDGANPKIDEGMIPVIIGNDGIVKKADISSKWYSYQDKNWANVVLVTDSSRSKHVNATPGSTISKGDILGYFVWIPRYKYKIPTSGTSTPSTIDIVFENKDTTKSNGNAKTEYLTHPGFTLADEELNGIWFAKFETTGTAANPTSLPNTASLRHQDFNSQYNTSLLFSNYGIKNNSHIPNNTQWATAAYLSHSKYGVNTEIRINNNSNSITGCGATSIDGDETSVCQNTYGSNINSYPQSTTGNITGVFDMSGGTWENVMALYYPNPEELSDDLFKYYNIYSTNDFDTACNNSLCYGHALFETENWYSDFYLGFNFTYFLASRGGASNGDYYSGAFSSVFAEGTAAEVSFRVVLD